jgi:TonB-linked SusC/RagA family outer membrane protein
MHHLTRSGPPRDAHGPGPRRRRWLGAALALLGLALAVPAAAQQGEISGVVVEAQSQRPVPGAQVTVQGQTRSAVTDPEGRFRITGVQGSSVMLQVDRIGYGRVTRTVTVGQTGVRIGVTTAALSLDAVVVTGTPGGAEKRTLGNAVTRLDVGEVVRDQPVSSVSDLLNARIPGVVIIPATGNVGGGSRIRVRGVSSLSLPQEPLIYVDGVRVLNDAATGPINQGFGSNSISRFNDISPEDIESIEVIRGPAAATLYGTEASNGVIQIITKRGAAGGTRWDLSVRQGAVWFANAEERVWDNWGVDAFTHDTVSMNIVEYQNSLGNDIWQTGRLQSYNLSLNGGTPSVRYYVAGGMDRDEGIEANNQVRRWNARVNLTAEPRSDMDIRASAGYVSGHITLPLEAGGGGTAWSSFFSTPGNVHNSDGSLNYHNGFYSASPEAYRYAYEDWQDVNRFTGSVEVNHRPTGWLAHRLALGADVTREQNVELIERMDDPGFMVFFDPNGEVPGYRDQNNRNISYTSLDYSASASYGLRENLSSSTAVGAQVYRRFTDIESAYGEDFPVRGLRAITAAAVTSGSSNYIEDVTVGVYAQQQVGWNNRLFVTAGLRADDNSNFGENFDLVYYPKVSAAWVVSEEPFFRLPWVSALKLRAAYGQTGQQPLFLTSNRTYRSVPGPGDVGTVTPDAAGNPDLGPERGKEVEVGLDAGFLDERLGLELTYYDKTTEDALLRRDVAPSSGFAGQQWFNAGEIRNRGVEMLLRGTPIRRDNVELELTLNLSTNANKIVDLGIEGLDTVQAGTFVRHVVGYPVGSWWEKRIVDAQFNAQGRLVAGSEMCDDGRGGTVACTAAPRLFLGRPTPSREGAFMPALTLFNRLRLAGMVDFKQGHHKLDGNLRVRCILFGRCRENFYPADYVDDPAWLAQTQRGGTYVTGLIQDASFTRLRELSATYTVPDAWAQRLGAGRASISVAGRNLYTWTNYSGMEPEASFLGGSRGGGSAQWEQNVTPQLAQFVTTLNLSF